MNCDRPDISEKLVPYVEGALGEPDKTEVAGHLRRCEACQEEAKLVKESILTLKAAVRTGIWKEPREHVSPEQLSLYYEDERAREAGFLASSGLTEFQAKDIRIHLAECGECREELAFLRELEAEPLAELGSGSQPLPRALRLEIERLYPTKAATQRTPGERTVSLADRLMALINPKSLVMASLCVVALTFGYTLTQNGEQGPTAMAPTPSSTEVAMLDKTETERHPAPTAAKPGKKEDALNKVGDQLGKTQKLQDEKNEKRTDAPVAARPDKAAEVKPQAQSETPARREATEPVRTASTQSAPRPETAGGERPSSPPRPAAQPRPVAARPVPKPAQPQRTVVSSVKPKSEKTPTTVAQATDTSEAGKDQGLLASSVDEEATRERDDDKQQAAQTQVANANDPAPPIEPVATVAAGPNSQVTNAGYSGGIPATEVATQPNPAPAPVSAAGAAPQNRIAVPAAAPTTAMRSNDLKGRTNVKPPAPAQVPVRSLPGASDTTAQAQTPASKIATQNVSRAADGIRPSDAVAMNRQADLGPRAKAVAKQFSVNASVLIEEHQDGSVTVTVRPDKPLTSEDKDKLRRALRSQLNLGDSDTISIRQ